LGILNSIRNLVENGLYYLTEHAIFEADNDDIAIYDIESVLLKGHIRRIWPREKKYEIIGVSRNKSIGVVCRVTETQKVRIITVYIDRPR